MLDELIQKYELQIRNAVSSNQILVASAKKDALQEYQFWLRDSASNDLSNIRLVGTRNPDHSTAVKAAKNLVPRLKNQWGRILMAFRRDELAGGGELNPDQVGRLAGLKDESISNSCYWHRVSDLRRDGFLEFTGEERPGESPGNTQKVLRLTEKGRAAADVLLDAATT